MCFTNINVLCCQEIWNRAVIIKFLLNKLVRSILRLGPTNLQKKELDQYFASTSTDASSTTRKRQLGNILRGGILKVFPRFPPPPPSHIVIEYVPPGMEATTRKRKLGSDNSQATTRKRQLGSDNS